MMQKLASDFLSNYIFLSVGRVGSSTELIVQKIEPVQDMDKRDHLINHLRRQKVHGANGKVRSVCFCSIDNCFSSVVCWIIDFVSVCLVQCSML